MPLSLHGLKRVQTRLPLLALAVLACLLIAACARRDADTDDNQHGSFYGGVSGGMTREP
jgi:hypothetical protein